ncbi:thiolase family protein [Lysobacter pythonis]|uniref:Thiolase family protein n=1 Tax=Solilutibacter pythonis TaxID=2483112 RepID=A0A3M2HV33_9GAMM|nr:thiolase family protein [Lysobacter pythonis]RMH93591.1 thiolase family protein [Lysobacter pythonis]
MLDSVMIVGAARTPMGRLQGRLAQVPAVSLAIGATRAALAQAGVPPEQAELAIFGNVLQAGLGQNPARQVALSLGLADVSSALTVNQVCGSGMQAIMLAAQAIASGEVQVAIAGGMESMSRAPFLLERARQGYRLGDGKLVDSLLRDGLTCALGGHSMGITAENVATHYRISRALQDQYSAATHARCRAAITAGAFKAEITPVHVPGQGGMTFVDEDELLESEVSHAALSALPPAFIPQGSVTAGNSSGIHDGAAALLLVSGEYARAHGLRPLARLRGWASAGCAPSMMGMSPLPAIRRLYARTGLHGSEIEHLELNEAFSAQVIALVRELGIRDEDERVNPLGGALALGHPLGASGSRIAVTLTHALVREERRLGVAAICAGGGQGNALLIERHGN